MKTDQFDFILKDLAFRSKNCEEILSVIFQKFQDEISFLNFLNLQESQTNILEIFEFLLNQEIQIENILNYESINFYSVLQNALNDPKSNRKSFH
jgi:hypothetical protein